MISQVITQLGDMSIPMLGLSIVALALIIERLVTYILQPSMSHGRVRRLLNELQVDGCSRCQAPAQAEHFCQQEHCLHQGVGVLFSHASSSKDVREEVAGLWLLKHRQRMHSGLRFLMLIGTLSPMVGLFGTVLGMIEMFQAMAATGGPVTPSVLADGLWTAMYTTAFGLGIAIPALAASHGFTIWANHYLARLEFVLNHVNLLIDGVDASKTERSAVSKPCQSGAHNLAVAAP